MQKCNVCIVINLPTLYPVRKYCLYYNKITIKTLLCFGGNCECCDYIQPFFSFLFRLQCKRDKGEQRIKKAAFKKRFRPAMTMSKKKVNFLPFFFGKGGNFTLSLPLFSLISPLWRMKCWTNLISLRKIAAEAKTVQTCVKHKDVSWWRFFPLGNSIRTTYYRSSGKTAEGKCWNILTSLCGNSENSEEEKELLLLF